uniref:Microfibrillar-associated protein 2 n=1 Tax=Jaculus jaculus TaxID=51337 RepID=A0A8C5L8Q2_JACJA
MRPLVHLANVGPGESSLEPGSLGFTGKRLTAKPSLQPCFFVLFSGLLAQGQYDLEPLPPFQYTQYSDQIDNSDYYDYQELSSRPPEEQFQFQSQQQVPQEVIPAPTPGRLESDPACPPDCREEQYPCTRLYSIHKPCKQCLNEVCFYSLRRVYVVNREICVRTVCAHEELLRADLCRDKFSKCGVMAVSGLCQSMAASCARSCGGC